MDFRATGLTDELFEANVDGLARAMADFFGDKSVAQYKNLFVSYRRQALSDGQRVHRIAPRQVSHYELHTIRTFPLLNAESANMSGFLPEKVTRRVLPYGSIARRTIGRRVDDSIMWGLEGAFDSQLRGNDGVTRMQRISGSFWMPVDDEGNREPENGYDVVSTIDIEWQDVAERALREQLQATRAFWGTAVLMEVATGEIRAMANLTRRADGTCVEDLNHALAQRINPGSTFKLANLIVLLDDAGMSLDEMIDVNHGRKQVGPRMVEDTHESPQRISLRRTFLESSNVGFAQAIYDHYRDPARGVKKNQQRYVDQLTKLGVRDTLPFPIAGLRGPLVHDTRASTWSDWSLPSMAYGYELEMTPLQTLVLYNTVANGGRMMTPLIVSELRQYGQTIERYEPQVLRRQIASPKAIALAQESLRGVATEGTARTLKIDGLDIAVKTGTAQIPNRNRGYRSGSGMDYLASLAGYFPAKDPQYSLIVAIQTRAEAGSNTVYYGGSLAGPVFRAIAERVYANSPEWNPSVAEQFPRSTELPVVKGGEARRVREALDGLEVRFREKTADNEWIAIEKDSMGTHVYAFVPPEGTVPDVKGLGLQDAVRLLEGLGMSVRFSGMGSVVYQSVAPGTPPDGQTVELTLALHKKEEEKKMNQDESHETQ